MLSVLLKFLNFKIVLVLRGKLTGPKLTHFLKNMRISIFQRAFGVDKCCHHTFKITLQLWENSPSSFPRPGHFQEAIWPQGTAQPCSLSLSSSSSPFQSQIRPVRIWKPGWRQERARGEGFFPTVGEALSEAFFTPPRTPRSRLVLRLKLEVWGALLRFQPGLQWGVHPAGAEHTAARPST